MLSRDVSSFVAKVGAYPVVIPSFKPSYCFCAVGKKNGLGSWEKILLEAGGAKKPFLLENPVWDSTEGERFNFKVLNESCNPLHFPWLPCSQQ